MNTNQNDQIRDTVRQGYAAIARGQSASCCGSGDCCSNQLTQALGYNNEDLDNLPQGADMGLSCGNPTALAQLQSGQTVLDLGSGGGLDVFIAAQKIGPAGRAIGVDMTPEMLRKARNATSIFTSQTGLSNLEFRLGEIEHLPVADNSIDVVISNCVINLSPDKPQVWREIARVLKPGGKACISDLALKKPLPESIRQSAAARVACIAGAILIDDSRALIRQANLTDIQIEEKQYNLDIMTDCNDPLYRLVKTELPPNETLNNYIISVNITAYKS